MFAPAFGLAVRDVESLRALPREAGCFETLAVHADVLANRPLLARKLRGFGASEGALYGLFDTALCSLAPESSGRVLTEFKSEFAHLAEFAAECGLKTLLVPFDVERAAMDAAYADRLVALLQSLYGVLYRHDEMLLLPFRLPRPGGGAQGGAYAAFLRRLMFPLAGFYLELHPHEPGFADPELVSALNGLSTTLRLAHVVYEPATGNRIRASALKPVLAPLLRYRRIRVVFDPAGGREYMESELSQLEAAVRTWNQPSNQEK